MCLFGVSVLIVNIDLNVQFQMDASMGYAAAVVEALVQSHFPGALHLLPSLPEALGRAG